MEDNKSKIEKFVKEAKDLLSIFEEVKQKTDLNSSSLLFKYLDRVTIAKFILPYLELKDLVNFRSTCKDINTSVSSTVAIVSYYKSVQKKSNKGPNFSAMFRSFNELNDADDIEAELESLKNVFSLFLIF
jgi:hypothetical protein